MISKSVLSLSLSLSLSSDVTIIVPVQVRAMLRALLQPVTLFGEGPFERRQRLRQFMMSSQDQDALNAATEAVDAMRASTAGMDVGAEDQDDLDVDEDEGDDDEEFFTRGRLAFLLVLGLADYSLGSTELQNARIWTLLYSIRRCRRRLRNQRLEQAIPLTRAKADRKSVYSKLHEFELYATQTAGDRPVSAVSIHPLGSCFLSGDFQGSIRLWSIPDCTLVREFKGKPIRNS
jgi:U4/U6 small nuclear ribonucleoprotein PRP4